MARWTPPRLAANQRIQPSGRPHCLQVTVRLWSTGSPVPLHQCGRSPHQQSHPYLRFDLGSRYQQASCPCGNPHQARWCFSRSIWKIKPLFESFIPYAQKYLAFDKPVCVNFLSDPENARNALGKTGYYDPESYEIGIYIDNRHPKDVLRSLAHELVHHAQNCAGMFKSDSTTSPGYAQKDPHLRRMERDAYERGNLCLRDWEDSIKIKLQETNYHNKRFKINEQLINNRYNNNYIITTTLYYVHYRTYAASIPVSPTASSTCSTI